MAQFNAAQVMREAGERREQLTGGEKLVPVAAAIIAVLAALATLFSNHSSVSGLEKRTLSGIFQTRAADDFNYYESSRIKIEVNQALDQSGIVTNAAASAAMSSRIANEQTKAKGILKRAQADQAPSDAYVQQAESSMKSYENYEVSATLFEVSIVLVSVTALMRSHALMWVAGSATLVGLGFFITGLFLH